jgi:predicted nucleic acid-binding protein
LLSLLLIVQVGENSVLGSAKEEALARIRDKDDWHALARALQLECAIWTEDQDFFGTGIATWTTSTMERYLES